jgi:hypothetical protein
VPLSNCVPRGFGFVHHSIAILYHEVPNPNLTIRNFFIAVSQGGGFTRGHRGVGGGGGDLHRWLARARCRPLAAVREPTLLEPQAWGLAPSPAKSSSGST